MVSDSCICRACEKHIKRNISSENYKPRWGSNQETTVKCILPECTETSVTGSIVHSSTATTEQIGSAFKVTVQSEGKLIPLCQVHYKHLHRFINAETYKHVKCFTCSATIKGSSRHCPDPVAIKQHFSKNVDIDFDLTENDIICTKCYNAHLEILRDWQDVSHDHHLRALVDDSSIIPVGQFTAYMSYALTEAIRRLGDVLLNRVVILLPELYQFLLKEARKKANEMGLDLDEAQLNQEMPKRCFLGRLACFFGKHLAYDETGKPLYYITKRHDFSQYITLFQIQTTNRKSKQFGTQRSANAYSFFNYIVFKHSSITICRLTIIAAKCSYP